MKNVAFKNGRARSFESDAALRKVARFLLKLTVRLRNARKPVPGEQRKVSSIGYCFGRGDAESEERKGSVRLSGAA